jgi:hypothetical protein
MTASGRRLMATIVVGVAFAVGAGSPLAGTQEKTEGAAPSLCKSHGGSFTSNGIFGVDTSQWPFYAGYYCVFAGPASGGTTTSETISAGGATHGLRALCEKHSRGVFYVFQRQIGPDPVNDVLDAVWGCDLAAVGSQVP